MTGMHVRAVVSDRGVDRRIHRRRRRSAGRPRPQRRGQIDGTARDRRPGAARQRSGTARRPHAHRHRGRRLRADPRAAGRHAVAGRVVVPSPECRGQCGVRAAQRPSQATAGARLAQPPRTGWTRSTLPSLPIGCRGSCPAVRPSESHWRARSPRSPTFCCSTNRSPVSTSPPPPRCESCCVTH